MTVVLTPRPTMAPVPRVEISVGVADLPAGSDRITLWRLAAGREFKVRDGVDRTMVSTVSLVDLEPPLVGSFSYEAECWDGDLSLGRVSLGSVSLGWTGGAVIQQPLDPSLSVEVQLKWGTATELTRRTPGELVYTSGAVMPDYVGFGPRRALQGVPLVIGVEDADLDRLQATLGTYDTPQLPIWLVRSTVGRIPSVFFCHVAALPEVDSSGYGGGIYEFPVTVDEVNPPATALVVSLLSYDDLDVSYVSYTAMDAAYASFDLRDRDYSLAGAAG